MNFIKRLSKKLVTKRTLAIILQGLSFIVLFSALIYLPFAVSFFEVIKICLTIVFSTILAFLIDV